MGQQREAQGQLVVALEVAGVGVLGMRADKKRVP